MKKGALAYIAASLIGIIGLVNFFFGLFHIQDYKSDPLITYAFMGAASFIAFGGKGLAQLLPSSFRKNDEETARKEET